MLNNTMQLLFPFRVSETVSCSADVPSKLRKLEIFEVGKKNVGTLKFLQPVDLSDVLDRIDEVVRILPGDICLYPADRNDTKPGRGEGLNVTAECTLHRIWPKKHEAGQPLEGRKLVKFIKKLQTVPQCVFKSYDGVSGEWNFEVKEGDWYSTDRVG